MTDTKYGGYTVAEWRALHEKATPGPWTVELYGCVGSDSLVIHSDANNRVCFLATPGDHSDRIAIAANAKLIAAIQGALPFLLSAVEKGEEESKTCGAGAAASDALDTPSTALEIAHQALRDIGQRVDDLNSNGQRHNAEVRSALDFITSECLTVLAGVPPIASTAEKALREALEHVRSIISEAAMKGFIYTDGDWPERLFASQAITKAALATPSTEGWRGSETCDAAASPFDHAAEFDANVDRLKACEHIADGDEGWEKLRNECPSTAAVARLRDRVLSTAGWQPMASAPKDGKKVCVWVEWRDTPRPHTGWYRDGHWIVDRGGQDVQPKVPIARWCAPPVPEQASHADEQPEPKASTS